MKTTIEIPDPLMQKLRETAARRGTTLKALVQAAIQQFLGAPRGSAARFKLRDGAFRGQGPAPGVREGDWRAVVEALYEGRGGVGGPSR